jgi:hypothetical protein
MRYFLILICFCFLACSSKKSSDPVNDKEITVSIDTVYLDGKGEILYLSYNLSLSDFSKDKAFLYNFNPQAPQVEVLDLDNLQFVERIPFDLEGPNGVGEYVNGFQLLGEDSVYINSFFQYGIFNWSAEKIMDLGFRDIMYEEWLVDDFFKSNNLHVALLDGYKLAGIFNDWRSGDSDPVFGMLDLNKKEFYLDSLNGFDYIEDFAPKNAESGRKEPLYWVISSLENDDILIGNNIGSDLYRFDSKNQILEFKSFEHSLFPSKKTIQVPNTIDSFVDYHRAYLESQEDINFLLPVWDESNQLYYRFSYINELGDVDGDLAPVSAKVFLSILDQDLNIVAESEIHELNKSPNFHFVKDRMIWIFENVNDEVSFIRVKIDL